MILMLIYLKGFIIGMAMSAPVGPIGLLCIRTGLKHGWRAGAAVGTGVAVADGIYAAIGAFGAVFLIDMFKEYSVIINIVGGAALIVVGLKVAISEKVPGSQQPIKAMDFSLLKDFTAAFFLALTSPATLFLFLGVFAVFGMNIYSDYTKGALLVFGVFCGSLVWNNMLGLIGAFLKKRLEDKIIHIIQLVSGGLIFCFGIGVLAFALKDFI